MDELPEGVELPKANVATPRPSASLIVSRMNGNIGEILLCHRVSEVPSFPDFWAFPGGGVSRTDRRVSEENPKWLEILPMLVSLGHSPGMLGQQFFSLRGVV